MTDTYSAEESMVFLDVLAQMVQFTGPSTVMICGSINDITGEIVGTGTLLNLRGGDYLLTAQHVAFEEFRRKADGSQKYPYGLCHTIGKYTPEMIGIVDPWMWCVPPQDLAVTRLDPVVLKGADCFTLNNAHLASSSPTMDDHDIYVVHGFIGKQTYFSTLDSIGNSANSSPGINADTLPYAGWWTESSTWSGFNKSIHFAITYPPDEIINERQKPTTLHQPGGLSGSLVWKTNKVNAGSEWTPNMARVVGVVHRFDQDSRCLIATRIECVRALLLHTLRSNYAYFRWTERGRPLWDDLEDWLTAERSIIDLDH